DLRFLPDGLSAAYRGLSQRLPAQFRTVSNYFERSNFTTDCNRTLAPFSMSAGVENSLGEWLQPPMLGTKIIPTGPITAISCASWPAPLGISLVLRPSSLAVASINF